MIEALCDTVRKKSNYITSGVDSDGEVSRNFHNFSLSYQKDSRGRNIYAQSFDFNNQENICGSTSGYFNIRGDFMFLIINFVVYLCIIIFKILEIRKKSVIRRKMKGYCISRSNTSDVSNCSRNYSSNINHNRNRNRNRRLIFRLKSFYLFDQSSISKNTFFYFTCFLKKCFSFFKRNQIQKEEWEIETNATNTSKHCSCRLTDSEIDMELERNHNKNNSDINNNNINKRERKNIVYVDKMEENGNQNLLKEDRIFILKNLDIKMKKYQVYCFSTLCNKDLNILCFFNYFFGNGENRRIGIDIESRQDADCIIDGRGEHLDRKTNCKYDEMALIPYMSIYEHFKILLIFKKKKIDDSQLFYFIYFFMMLVNLKCDIYRRCNELSGGMKKKVLLLLHFLRNEKLTFLYKINDSIDFCSQIYINIILKNILLQREMYTSSADTEYEKDIYVNIPFFNFEKEEKTKAKQNRFSKTPTEHHTNSLLETKQSDIDFLAFSNLSSFDETLFYTFIKKNILQMSFNIQCFALYTHIYTDIFYYDFLYLFHHNEIAYKNKIQKLQNQFKSTFSLRVKLKCVPLRTIRKYIKVYLLSHEETFKRLLIFLICFRSIKQEKSRGFKKNRKKVRRKRGKEKQILKSCMGVTNVESGTANGKKLEEGNEPINNSFQNRKHSSIGGNQKLQKTNGSTYDRLQRNVSSFLKTDLWRKRALSRNDINVIFRIKEMKFQKTQQIIRFMKIYKVVFKLLTDKSSLFYKYIDNNRYISLCNLFRFVVYQILYEQIYSTILNSIQSKCLIHCKIIDSRNFFFILQAQDINGFFDIAGKMIMRNV